MKTTLENLGFNAFFEKIRNKLGLNQSSLARVISEHKEAYVLKSIDSEYFARVTGKQIFTASTREDYPVVGDWVVFEKIDNGKAVIRKILPRFSLLKRRFRDKNNQNSNTQVIASNIDVAFIVQSVDRDYSLNRFERYFAIAQNSHVKPIAILNKVDLLEKSELQDKIEQFKNRFPNIELIATSMINYKNICELKNNILEGKTYCFLGSSGVGKSSLINKLIGDDFFKTNDISLHSARGKHTTTSRQMYFLENGGIVVDNPGIREVGITNRTDEISSSFVDISDLSIRCKYPNCTHTHEPNCKVLEAKKVGVVGEEQYLNYLNLKKEAEHNEMSDFEKRRKDRQFGKFIKKAKEDLNELM